MSTTAGEITKDAPVATVAHTEEARHGAARSTGRLLEQRTFARVRLFVDIVILLAADAAAVLAGPSSATGSGLTVAIAFPVLALVMLHARRLPDERLDGSALDTVVNVLGVISLSAMLSIAGDVLMGGSRPIGLPLRLWAFSFTYVGTARVVLLLVRRTAIRNQVLATPTLIIGAGIIGERLSYRLATSPQYGLRPVGFLDADPLLGASRLRAGVPVLGSPDDLQEAIQKTGARHAIFAFSSDPDHMLIETLRECQRLGVEVSMVPRLYELINERSGLQFVGGLPLLMLRPTDPRSWHFAVKHGFDRAFALLALIAIAPVMGLIALLIKLSSPGPVLFRQRRVGRDGHAFCVLKFRTMRPPTGEQKFDPAPGSAPGGIEGEDRTTRLGRLLRDTSLDELPQLFNVLRGDMSIVGPRPERPEFVEQFTQDVARYEERHRVKSGITGWAQVNGLRGQTSIADRVEWDNYYIQNWSLRLDARIIVLTLHEVVRHSGRSRTPASE